MPIYSRLLAFHLRPTALLFIIAGNCFALNSSAQVDTTMPGTGLAQATPATIQTPAAGTRESISNEFPYNAQNVPSASVAAVNTSNPNSNTTGNELQVSKPWDAEHSVPVVESAKVVGNQCAKPAENQFHKSLLMMAFPRLVANTSTAGELSEAEHQIPQLLSQLLVNQQSAVTPVHLTQGLPTPDLSNSSQLAMQVQRLARNHRSQLVISGEILDMSMANPNATYNPGFFTRIVNGTFDFIEARNRFDKRDRVFSFQLHMRDGFTGQLLFTKRYNTFGVWSEKREVGFGSAPFWKTDYGQQVKGLIRKASIDVSEVIQCQPFIAQIDSRPGQTQVTLQGGANNGLHTGDMLTLYQLVIEGSETQYQQHDVRMVNRNTAIELREVYPSHSVGVINTTSYLTGQFLAVAP